MRCRSNAAVAAGVWLAAASLIAGCGGQATRSPQGAGAAGGTAGSSGSAGSSSSGTGGGSGSSGCAGAVAFDDPTIEEAVRAAVGVPDGPIELSALGGVTTLFTRGAASLGGVECLSALTTFRSVEGTLSDLTALRDLTQLESVFVSDNQIADISALSDHAALRSVDLSRNPLSNPTPLEGLPALSELRLDGCGLEVLPEPSGPLEVLFASDNRIAVLTPLVGVTSLRELRVSGNDLTSLAPLSELVNLEIVAAENNAIVDLTPLSGKPRLERVMIGHNAVTDLSPLSGLPAIQVIDADNNQISTLAGTVLPAPRCGSELDFTYNPITTGDLEYVCSQGWVTRWGTNPPQTCNAPCLQ
jgi:hypothetical protein